MCVLVSEKIAWACTFLVISLNTTKKVDQLVINKNFFFKSDLPHMVLFRLPHSEIEVHSINRFSVTFRILR